MLHAQCSMFCQINGKQARFVMSSSLLYIVRICQPRNRLGYCTITQPYFRLKRYNNKTTTYFIDLNWKWAHGWHFSMSFSYKSNNQVCRTKKKKHWQENTSNHLWCCSSPTPHLIYNLQLESKPIVACLHNVITNVQWLKAINYVKWCWWSAELDRIQPNWFRIA